jgi:hypothetical protein
MVIKFSATYGDIRPIIMLGNTVTDPVLIQMNPVYKLTSYFSIINFNFPRTSKCSLTSDFLFACFFLIKCFYVLPDFINLMLCYVYFKL